MINCKNHIRSFPELRVFLEKKLYDKTPDKKCSIICL